MASGSIVFTKQANLNRYFITPKHSLVFSIALSALADIADGKVTYFTQDGGKYIFDYKTLIEEKIGLQNPDDFLKKFSNFFKHRASIDTFEDTQELLLPIYSKNGSMGYNTILFCAMNGYFPLGIGLNFYPVHANNFKGNRMETIKHDYIHALIRTRKLFQRSEKTFNIYRSIYIKIFDHRDENILKDLFFLFLLVHEIECNIESNNFEINTAKLMPVRKEINSDLLIMYEKLVKKYEYIYDVFIRDSIDFSSKLMELNFMLTPIDLKNPNLEDYFNFNQSVRNALEDFWQYMTKRYPELLGK